MAVRDEAQARLTVEKAEVCGMPACSEAMRPAFEPPSSERTVPTTTDWIRLGSSLGFLTRVALRTWWVC